MTASLNIKTPTMDVPLLPSKDAQLKGEELKKKFTKVYLSDVRKCPSSWTSIIIPLPLPFTITTALAQHTLASARLFLFV